MKDNKKYLSIIMILLFYSCGLFTSTRVSDSVFIYQYRPFDNETLAVKLPEISTLQMDDNLPKLDGATALYPLYSAFVQAAYPEGEYPLIGDWNDDLHDRIPSIVGASGTSAAYRNLIEGKVDIIFCAKPSLDQIEKAEEKGITFSLTPIGKEAFVFFVNERNRISNLSTEQIRGIYSGRIVNWSEVGGNKSSIKIYQRPKNSGSQTMLETIMENEKIVEPITEEVLTFMLDIVTQTADYRNYNNAIGYSFLFFTTQMVQNNKIKLLSINGIYPSIETIQSNSYPYADEFYAISTSNENENVNKFIEWILSEQGQYLVEETGYVPIK
jgi:phosphate transport system substrate-binding protein